MQDFPALLESLFVEEYRKTPDEAARLVKKHTKIVMAGIMSGLTFTSLRATAMAIEMAETDGPQIMNDPRFEHMTLDDLQTMMREMVREGPPTEQSDAEFLRALANEIGLRQKQVQVEG